MNRIPGAVLIGLMVCGGCIEPFEPELNESQSSVVIVGTLTDKPGRQEVRISRTSSYRLPEHLPLENCIVTASNQRGEMIHYLEEEAGLYVADAPDDFLETGDAASLFVIDPDGQEIRSEYDTVLACPSIDRTYYEIQSRETEDPERTLIGLQFYLDMSGAATDARDVIWRVEESWEYWAALIGTHRWHENGEWEEFRSNPLFKCWHQEKVQEVYTGSSRTLSENRMERVELNYVSSQTDRLSVTYSLLVRQQSLTRSSFDYWSRMQDQAMASGGLFETQAATIPGNLSMDGDSGGPVLGHFTVCQEKESRIFVHNNNLFDFSVQHIECEYQPMSVIYTWDPIVWPIYLYNPGNFEPLLTAESYCFDCRLQGGSPIQPEFWESWHSK
ncbi:MAG: DUF4249 domain-containing protein [Bacteroidales bacterium]